jgi:hypothetical protein
MATLRGKKWILSFAATMCVSHFTTPDNNDHRLKKLPIGALVLDMDGTLVNRAALE